MFKISGNIKVKKFVGNLIIARDVRNVVQKFKTVINQKIYMSSKPHDLPINWQELPKVRKDGEVDYFKLLEWRVRLPAKLVGREKEFLQLLSWCLGPESAAIVLSHALKKGPSTKTKPGPFGFQRFQKVFSKGATERNIKISVLTGTGGVGKSRLAAEVADALQNEDWSSGFVQLHRDQEVPISKKGVLIVVDYPEENPEALRFFLNDLAEIENPPAPVRVLLLSRKREHWWRNLVLQTGAKSFLNDDFIFLPPLGIKGGMELFQAVQDTLAEHYAIEKKCNETTIRRWISTDPRLHKTPLIVQAAAIHNAFILEDSLNLNGKAIVSALVDREMAYVKRVAKGFRIEKEGAETLLKLLGLAMVSDGILESSLEKLLVLERRLGAPEREKLIESVMKTPWWKADQLQAPKPDIFGANLLFKMLLIRKSRAPEWLWAAIKSNPRGSLDRLGRILFDIAIVNGKGAAEFSKWLEQMIGDDLNRAKLILPLTGGADQVGLSGMVMLIHTLLLGDKSLKVSERIQMHRSLAVDYGSIGQHQKSIEVAESGLKIARRAFAKTKNFTSAKELVFCLNVLGNALESPKQKNRAMKYLKEAVSLAREYYDVTDLKTIRPLRNSLRNLSIVMEDFGKKQEASELNKEEKKLIEMEAMKLESDDVLSSQATLLYNHALKPMYNGSEKTAAIFLKESLKYANTLYDKDKTKHGPLYAKILLANADCLSRIEDRQEELEKIGRKAENVLSILTDIDFESFAGSLAEAKVYLWCRQGGDEAFSNMLSALEICEKLKARSLPVPKMFFHFIRYFCKDTDDPKYKGLCERAILVTGTSRK